MFTTQTYQYHLPTQQKAVIAIDLRHEIWDLTYTLAYKYQVFDEYRSDGRKINYKQMN